MFVIHIDESSDDRRTAFSLHFLFVFHSYRIHPKAILQHVQKDDKHRCRYDHDNGDVSKGLGDHSTNDDALRCKLAMPARETITQALARVVPERRLTDTVVLTDDILAVVDFGLAMPTTPSQRARTCIRCVGRCHAGS